MIKTRKKRSNKIHRETNQFINEKQFIDSVMFKFGIDDLKGRTRPLPQVKQSISYILYNKFKLYNLSRVSELVDCNHATVIHHLKNVELLFDPNDQFHHIWEVVLKIYKEQSSPNIMGVIWEMKNRSIN